MQTKLCKIDRTNIGASTDVLKEASAILRDGGLVAFPTETVYGLGANALSAEAALSVFAAKGRPADNPLIVHVARPEDAEAFAHTTPLYYRLAEAFMPGPLTVILQKKPIIPDAVTGGLDSVAIRCPSDPVAHALIEVSGLPIAAPSANRSGKPSPTTAAHVFEDMDGIIPMILDGGESDVGVESTVIKLDGEGVILLRPGAVTPEMLREIVEDVRISSAVTEELGVGEKPLSPGMKYKHYAPTASLILLDGPSEAFVAYVKEQAATGFCVALCYEEETEALTAVPHLSVGYRSDIGAQTHRLFRQLREADALGADYIYAHLPTMEGGGLALYNRMIRAAAHHIEKIGKKVED
ncbi:MAG: threonylcarbamoyl-AMP synthase [Clostridia bacterium]|nr:threonylcarbamoyl-AMP synthase [Clostridia bacterium]